MLPNIAQLWARLNSHSVDECLLWLPHDGIKAPHKNWFKCGDWWGHSHQENLVRWILTGLDFQQGAGQVWNGLKEQGGAFIVVRGWGQAEGPSALPGLSWFPFPSSERERAWVLSRQPAQLWSGRGRERHGALRLSAVTYQKWSQTLLQSIT